MAFVARALFSAPKDPVMIPEAHLRGYLLEEGLAWLLRNAGYRLLVDVSQDTDELAMGGNGLRVKGRGADHQVDVLGEFVFTPAFSFPIRLFLEAKFTRQKTGLGAVRNAHGVVYDVNENFVHGHGQRLRKRYRYVYALFSAKGFAKEAQDFALAHQISLIDLSGASFSWLLDAVKTAAADLYVQEVEHRAEKFPLGWMRAQLRQMLGTMPAVPSNASSQPETDARVLTDAARPVLRTFTSSFLQQQQNEVLLGFPAAPFILPLATDHADRFVAYAGSYPQHSIQLRRTGESNQAEWTVSPVDAPGPEGYSLTFKLPDDLESWISQTEQDRASRTRAVKREFLSDIIVYRLVDDNLQTFQLRYQPGALRRERG